MTGRQRLAAPALALLLVGAACATDPESGPASATTGSDATPPTTTTTTEAPTPLPPHERDELAEIFDPLVAPFGYRVTRASLIDRDSLENVPDGTHLAIYLAPDTEADIETVAADFAPLVAAFVPVVFQRYPGLMSFDLCQEPFQEEPADFPPPPQTLFDVKREAAETLEWEDLDLATLLSYAELDGVVVWGRVGTITETATWKEAAGR